MRPLETNENYGSLCAEMLGIILRSFTERSQALQTPWAPWTLWSQQTIRLGLRKTWLWSWLLYHRDLWSWASHLASLGVSFLASNMGRTTSISLYQRAAVRLRSINKCNDVWKSLEA